ncbi:hypothetical protein PaecuDRAFT_2018 [Paenibacillus curdlanolyticus YK9]|uniref:Uncharacterized protein n=1 Tax=Paenibacillus curdlanolyticus YK9 TaxID=717606 RepID=E0I8P0_9BACL|nr:hypothetical protein PaecuDRAFT_2018 [Paenibacillus curdlanolyticus YK9]
MRLKQSKPPFPLYKMQGYLLTSAACVDSIVQTAMSRRLQAPTPPENDVPPSAARPSRTHSPIHMSLSTRPSRTPSVRPTRIQQHVRPQSALNHNANRCSAKKKRSAPQPSRLRRHPFTSSIARCAPRQNAAAHPALSSAQGDCTGRHRRACGCSP